MPLHRWQARAAEATQINQSCPSRSRAEGCWSWVREARGLESEHGEVIGLRRSMWCFN